MKTSSLSFATRMDDSRPLAVQARSIQADCQKDEDFGIALLNRMAGRILGTAPLHDVLEDVVQFVATVAECDSCMVYVLERDELVLRASRNAHPEAADRLKTRIGRETIGWMAEHPEPVSVSKCAYEDPRFKLFHAHPEDRFESILSVPVVSGGRLVGVINVHNSSQHRHGNREINLIATLAFLVGAEIERARLENENLQLSGQLETRKLMERAKGILQRDLRITEEEAYLTLQRESRQRRKPVKQVAEALVLSDELRREKSVVFPGKYTKS